MRAEVQPRVQMRRDDERRIPVPAKRRAALLLLGLNADPLAVPLVVAHDDAVLELGVDGIGILRIHARHEAVAALRHEPVLVQDAVLRSRPRRSTERVVVLRPAIDVVKGLRVVDVDVVELRQRQILEEDPVRAAIERSIQPAVVSDEEVIGVPGIDPDDVIVDVHVARPQ